MIPDRRFRPEPMTASEAIAWLQAHRYIWYQAPMDHSPRKVHCTSALRLWTRSPGRFSGGVQVLTDGGELRFQVNENHLDRLRMPFYRWHHGITATVSHVDYVGKPHQIVLSQSNGFHLAMASLSHAVNFAKHKAMQLTVGCGRRSRVLVPARPPISGEVNF